MGLVAPLWWCVEGLRKGAWGSCGCNSGVCVWMGGPGQRSYHIELRGESDGVESILLSDVALELLRPIEHGRDLGFCHHHRGGPAGRDKHG